MRITRVLALMIVSVLTATSLSLAGPGGPPARSPKVKSLGAGELFCPSHVLVVSNIVIQSGRCYVLFVLRDTQGTFLAFAPREARIPPGQLVRLTTPAGAKLRGRIFYLVPIVTTVTIVPVNTVTLIATRVEDFGPRLSLTIIGTPNPNLTVIFSVRL